MKKVNKKVSVNGERSNRIRTEHNRELEKLINLFLKYDELVDEEKEHGCYSTPEAVPFEFINERDYYGKHERIVNNVRKAYEKIRKFIDEYACSFSKDVFSVVSSEFTDVLGTFTNHEDAFKFMMMTKEDYLKEFKDETVEFENDNQVIIRCGDGTNDYRYEIKIVKSKIQF